MTLLVNDDKYWKVQAESEEMVYCIRKLSEDGLPGSTLIHTFSNFTKKVDQVGPDRERGL